MRRFLMTSFLAATPWLVPAAGQSAALAAGDNASAAHACQQGGYLTVVGFSNGTLITFSNAGQCASYAAQGGTLYKTGGGPQSFFVDAQTAGLQDSGIALTKGEIAVVTATGTASCDTTGGCTTGPAGNGQPAYGFDDCGPFLSYLLSVTNISQYSLVGQVGTGPAQLVQIGAGPAGFSGPGELYLAYNDQMFCYDDNSGGYSTSITTYTPVS